MTDILPLRDPVANSPVDDPLPESGDLARLIDREEFARRLSIGVSTFDRLRAAGRIGPLPIRLGGALRFRLVEVVAWITTPAPNGELHDNETWSAVWTAMQKKPGHAGR